MASLVLLKGGESTIYELKQHEMVMGRHTDCQIHLDSNMVSRKHARVICEDSTWYVEDLGSGNGTVINGQRITSKAVLKHDDRIKVGPMLLRFEDSTTAITTKAAAAAAVSRSNPVAETTPFDLTVVGDKGDAATIMASLEGGSGKYSLDVQPEVKLRAIIEISRNLAGTVDLDALLPKILDSLFSVFPAADRGCVLLKSETGQMIPKAIKHRRESDDDSVKLSRTILNKVLQDKTGILSADAANDARFEASESISNFTIRSMMCVPLLGLDGEPIGIINIDTQNPLKQFKKDDLDLLMVVAGQAAVCYENARLAVTYMEKQKQDNEMRIAANVQRALLPETLPTVEGYDFFASYDSAQAVGGDYYDCLVLPGKKMCLAFGDVAGKGVPASLVMSRLSSVVQSTMEFVNEAGEAVGRINNHMCANAVEGRFVTFVLVILDTQTHEMSLSIAGHMSPIIRHANGSLEEFPEESVGLPLGVASGMPYDVITYKIQPGETIVIYTDGVSEAMNPKNDLYGMDRLREMITKNPADPTEMGKVILADVRKFAAGRSQSDDITLMCFGRKPAVDSPTEIVKGRNS
jgi:serine phosphatase RsbU (regulator of sigma subunit)/pSer/pThr/pTyr-binding forkhead associated (FHA) protein